MMKKSTFSLLFSLLLILSCLLASCHTDESIFGASEEDPYADLTYESILRDLEDQIIELQQSQYISNAESKKELKRLEELLAELSKETEKTPPTSDTDEPEAAPPASNEKPEQFLYTTNGTTATVTGYTGKATHLVIPAVIDGYTVTEIADNAFENGTPESVIISNGIQKIGWFAFQKCESLTSITLPQSIQSIGYSAFSGTSDSFTVYAPEGSYAQQYAQSYGLRSAVI